MAKQRGFALTGPGGMLRQFTKTVLESALDEETGGRLGRGKHRKTKDGRAGNVCNGVMRKPRRSHASPARNHRTPRAPNTRRVTRWKPALNAFTPSPTACRATRNNNENTSHTLNKTDPTRRSKVCHMHPRHSKASQAPFAIRTWVQEHRHICWNILFLIMFVAIGLLPLQPINIAYTVEFSGNVPDGTKIAFSFNRDSNTPKGSTQYTAVTSGSARINLDPANGQSQTLSMILQQQNISIQQFSSSISIPKDHINITLTCISGNTIHAQAAGEATSFTLSQQQLKSVHSAAAFQSEVKVFLLIFLGFVYLIYLARISLLRGISRPYFGVIIACVIIAVGLATYIATQSTSRLKYRVFAIALLLLLLPVLAVNYLIGKRCGTVARKSLIIVDYGGVLAYMTVQFHLFTTQLGGFPDEIAHLSYIAYMKLHGGVGSRFQRNADIS